MRQRGVDGIEVALDHRLTPFAVGLFDGVLDGGDSFVAGQDAAQREEAGLHDGVYPVTHADFLRDGIAINDMEAQLLFRDRMLHLAREMIPYLVGTEGAVQQERGSVACGIQDGKTLEKAKLMARDEIRP